MFESALKRVADAYGAAPIAPGPLREFQRAVLDDWEWNDKCWPRPRNNTPLHDQLLEELDTLCDKLTSWHRRAKAEDWPEFELIRHLHSEMVSFMSSPSFVCPYQITSKPHLHCRTMRATSWRPSFAKSTSHPPRQQFPAKVNPHMNFQIHACGTLL